MHADGIARAGGKNLVARAVQIVTVDGGAPHIFAGRVVGAGTYAHINLRAGFVDEQTTGPMMRIHALQRNNFLPGAGGHGFGVVLVLLHGIRFPDVKVAVPKGQSVGLIQALDQFLAALVASAREHVNRAVRLLFRVRKNDFVARPQNHEARAVEIFGPHFNMKAGGYGEVSSGGLRNYARAVVDIGCRVGRRQFGIISRMEEKAGCQEHSNSQENPSQIDTYMRERGAFRVCAREWDQIQNAGAASGPGQVEKERFGTVFAALVRRYLAAMRARRRRARSGARNWRRALASIWRMRSRVTSNSCPISSSVCSRSQPLPNRMRMTFSSFGESVFRMPAVSSRTFDSMTASTGEPTQRSSIRSPNADSPSRPTGVSSDTGSREMVLSFWTFSTGISIRRPISSLVGVRPSSFSSSRDARRNLFMLSFM